MLNDRADRGRGYRALGLDECRRLLAAAVKAPVRFKMGGPERSLLYRLALESGLRACELRSLVRADFNLEANPPTATVGAAYSKHRRQDTVPLRPATADALREHLRPKLPTAKAFNMPRPEHTSRMVRADLKEAGIPYVDSYGRHANFHAFRYTCIAMLAQSGCGRS